MNEETIKVGDIVKIKDAESKLIFVYPFVVLTSSAIQDYQVIRTVDVGELDPNGNNMFTDVSHTYVEIERCDGREIEKCIPNTSQGYSSKSMVMDVADLVKIEDRRF